jgi:molybdopterin molybdotransferase
MPGDLIPVDEARSRILAAVRRLPAEEVAVAAALGRVLAEDVVSDLDLPPFDSSAMDGFAVPAGAAGELEVVGESRAGRPAEQPLRPGAAIRISTGAVVPDGPQVAVVPVERVDEGGSRVTVPDTEPGANVRRAGEDVRAGQAVIAAGAVVGPAETGMLAALGRERVRCAPRPVVRIAATGDELRPPGEPLAPGQIYDSNAAALAALATQAGADVAERSWVADEPGLTESTLERMVAAGLDVLVVSGGVSVGAHDHVRPALARLGFEGQIWGVRLKPGKPLWFGVRDDGPRRQLAFGLPGNPVSAIVTFLLFARPALRAMQGADPGIRRASARLEAPVRRSPERDQAVRCRLHVDGDGWRAEPTGAQGSHVLSSMLGADALALVPAGDGDLAAGERVEIELI